MLASIDLLIAGVAVEIAKKLVIEIKSKMEANDVMVTKKKGKINSEKNKKKIPPENFHSKYK